MVAREKVRLSDLRTILEPFPQVQVNIEIKHKEPLEQLDSVQRVIDGIEEQLGDDGRVLVRYSGTEPKARIMGEGPNATAVSAYANTIAEELKRVLN